MTYTLREHTLASPYIKTLSRHRTLKAAKAAKQRAEKRNPPPQYALVGRYFIVKPVTLITGTGNFTNAYYHVRWGKNRNGTTVTRRARGYSDYPELMGLVAAGLLEVRPTGPRGGDRWHATRQGRRAVAKAEATTTE